MLTSDSDNNNSDDRSLCRYDACTAEGRGARSQLFLHLSRADDAGHCGEWVPRVWHSRGSHVWHKARYDTPHTCSRTDGDPWHWTSGINKPVIDIGLCPRSGAVSMVGRFEYTCSVISVLSPVGWHWVYAFFHVSCSWPLRANMLSSTHTHTHTRLTALFSGTIHFTSPAGWLPVYRDQLRAQRSVTSMGKLALTQVSRYLKGKTNLDFTEARDSEWQWHQLGHMQVCTLL